MSNVVLGKVLSSWRKETPNHDFAFRGISDTQWVKQGGLMHLIAGIVAVFLAADGIASGLNVELGRSVRWKTLRERVCELPVVWPAGAVSANLSVVGLAGQTTSYPIEFGADTITWAAFSGDCPEVEDLVTLTLSYKDSEGRLVAQENAEVAVTRAAFGAEVRVVDSSSVQWKKSNRQIVVPYSIDWLKDGTEGETKLTFSQRESVVELMSDQPNGYFGYYFNGSKWAGEDIDVSLLISGSSDILVGKICPRYPGLVLIFK